MKRLFSLLLVMLALIACTAPGALAALQDDASCAHHLHNADCGGLASGGGVCSFACEACRDLLQSMVNTLPKANLINESNWRDAAMLLSAIDAARLQVTSGTSNAVNWKAYEDVALTCELMQDDTLNELARIAITKSMSTDAGGTCTPSFAFVDEYGMPAEVSLDNCLTASSSPFPVSVGEMVILHVRPGTYTIEEYVDGDYTMTATLNGEPAENNRITLTSGGDYRLSIVNSYIPSSLTVRNTVVSDLAADKNQDFTFTVTLGDTTISGTYGDMTFTNGVATFKLKADEYLTTKDLPSNLEYTVTQKTADGFTMSKSGDTGTITKEKTAAFTNTRKTSSLTVSNTVVSNLDADKEKTFGFTVTLGDTTISGTYGDMTFTNGVATITLKDGESIIAEGLPTSLAYTVEQTDVIGFTTTKSGNEGTIIEEDEEDEDAAAAAAAAFTNTREIGSLKVTNTVESTLAADKNKEFEFTVTLSDTTISGTYSDMKFVNGVAEFSLKDGESKTAEGLPTSLTYTVTQTTADGFTTIKSGDTGTITKEKTAAAEFSNTRETGSLEISNTVVSDLAADKNQDFTFTVTLNDLTIYGTFGDMEFESSVATFTLKHGESKTAEDLPTSLTYTVTQETADGFTTIKSGDTGTITKEKTAAAEFSNTRETGRLTVSNTVVSNLDADKEKAFGFTVTLGDKTINGTYGGMTFTDGVATFTLKDGESKTAVRLPTSLTYTVEQTTANGFTTTKSGDEGTIIEEDEDAAAAAFTNTREYGSLVVSNTVVSALAADKAQAFEFTVTLGDTTINGTYGGMTFTDGVAAFTLKAGKSVTAEGLPVGLTYTVMQAAADGFAMTTSNASGKIIKEKVTAAFTNTRETGALVVRNNVVSNLAADKNKDFEFTVTLSDAAISGTFGEMTFNNGIAAFMLKDGESAAAQGLPTGLEYTVTQASADDFTTSKSGDTGMITEEDSAVAAFTNTRVLAVTPDHSSTSTIELTTGMSGELSVTAIGGTAPYSYQWYASTGSGFEPLADANSPEFRTPAVTMDNIGDQYYCVVTDTAQNSVQSGVFTIQVSNPAQLPKTGDSSRTGLWVTLMLLSASGFLALSRRRSRA